MFNRGGFTLIEILVVVSIIGILTSVIYVSFTDARENSRNKAMQVELKELQLAIETYRAQNTAYPLPTSDCRTTETVGSDTQLIAISSVCAGMYIDGFVPEFTPSLPLEEDSANEDCDIEYRTDDVGSWYKLTAVNCLAGVDQDSGVSENAPLSRCPSLCGVGDACHPSDPSNPNHYESFAYYSLGGQCQ